MIWTLTLVILRTTLTFVDPNPHYSHGDCLKEGERQAAWYEIDGVVVRAECEMSDGIKKAQVYVFDDVPLEVIIITSQGKEIARRCVQWDGMTLVACGGTMTPEEPTP